MPQESEGKHNELGPKQLDIIGPLKWPDPDGLASLTFIEEGATILKMCA